MDQTFRINIDTDISLIQILCMDIGHWTGTADQTFRINIDTDISLKQILCMDMTDFSLKTYCLDKDKVCK